MESLIVDFAKYSRAFAIFLVLREDWALDYIYTQFFIFVEVRNRL